MTRYPKRPGASPYPADQPDSPATASIRRNNASEVSIDITTRNAPERHTERAELSRPTRQNQDRRTADGQGASPYATSIPEGQSTGIQKPIRMATA